VTVLVP